jgi:16S rRNA (cytidine1402-2'-O)-methyltransferase
MIFYEAPHRLTKTLVYFAEYFGLEREISLTRELTKLHEDSWHGTIESAIAHHQHHQPIGEYTIIVKGNEQKELLTLSSEEIKEEIEKLMNEGMTKSSACQHLSQYITLSRREIYAIANLR